MGGGPIMLGELFCNGDEESLADCRHSGVGGYTCGGYDRARVVCSNGMNKIDTDNPLLQLGIFSSNSFQCMSFRWSNFYSEIGWMAY